MRENGKWCRVSKIHKFQITPYLFVLSLLSFVGMEDSVHLLEGKLYSLQKKIIQDKKYYQIRKVKKHLSSTTNDNDKKMHIVNKVLIKFF